MELGDYGSGSLSPRRADRKVVPRSGELVRGPSASLGKPIEWVDTATREEALSYLPPSLTSLVNKEAGPPVAWCAYARDESAPTYVLLGEDALCVCAARLVSKPAPSAGGRRWRASLTIARIDPARIEHDDPHARPYRASGGGPGRGSGHGRPLAWLDEEYRGGLGRLPERTQLYVLAPFVGTPPRTRGWNAFRKPEGSWVTEQTWFWLANESMFAFASAERSVHASSDWDTAYADLERAPWQVSSWRGTLLEFGQRDVWAR